MGREFKFDREVDLAVPPGTFPIVACAFAPPEGVLTIFGYLPDATFTSVDVAGPTERLQLPFNRPKVFLRHQGALSRVRVRCVGWTEPEGCGGPKKLKPAPGRTKARNGGSR